MARGTYARRKGVDISDSTIVISFLVFVILLVVFFGNTEIAATEKTKTDPDMLLGKLAVDYPNQNGPAVIVGNSIDTLTLSRFANMEYPEFKTLLGANSDFIIYFEDMDGNLVEVIDKPCIGSGYAYVNGYKCSE